MKIKHLMLSAIVFFPFSSSLGQMGNYYGESLERAIDILEYQQDEVWVLSESYIQRFDNSTNQMTLYDANLFADNPGNLQSLCWAKDSLWAAADSGVYKFDGQNWLKIPISGLTAPVSKIKFTVDYKMWLIAGGNLYSYSGNILKNENVQADAIATYLNKVFVGTSSNFNTGKVYENGIWTNLPNPISQKARNISQLEADGLGNIWSANRNGISIYDGSSWTDLYQNNAGCLDLFIMKNKAYSSIEVKYSSYLNDGSLIELSKQGQIDTLLYPSLEFNNANTAITKGWNGSILMTKTNNNEIFRFYPNLNSSSVYKELKTNTLVGGIAPNGNLFQDFSTPNYYKGLRAENKSSIYTSSLWISGKTNNSELVAANRFGTGSDYFSGPISNQYDSLYVAKYNRVWKVTKIEIERHKKNYNTSTYTMPEAIKNWPGNGDISKGEAKYIAAFVDQNYNEKYEPHLGDYPDIKGDEAIYSISNDHRGPKGNSKSQAMGIEIHTMIYSYDSISSAALHNTIFVRYKVINRSTNNYSNFKIGFWSDWDLGNPLDDLVGCDSLDNIFFAYNADSDDQGPNGFGQFPPAMGGVFLSDSMSAFGYTTNSGPIALWRPDSAEQYINILKSKWSNGEPISLENPSGFMNTLNGDGLDPTGLSAKTRFAYNSAANWYNSPSEDGDYKSISILDIGMLNSDEFTCLDLALVYGRDMQDSNLVASLNVFRGYTDSIKSFYAKENQVCLGESISVEEESVKSESLAVIYPNPISRGDLLSIKMENAISQVSFFDSQGKLVYQFNSNSTKELEIRIPNHIGKGMYFIKIDDDKGISNTSKLILD